MEKINIAELLKDCPKGMELDCTMFENVTFVRVDMNKRQFPIEIAVSGIRSKYLTKEGCFHDITLLPESKCVIFPKGKTTWEGFVPPCQFKDGDVVVNASNKNSNAFIYAGEDEDYYSSYIGLTIGPFPTLLIDKRFTWVSKQSGIRFATEEEKAKLFQAIKDNGYRWNAESKTLEKIEPNFKVGDRIVEKNGITKPFTISQVGGGYYCSNDKNAVGIMRIEDQDKYELVLNKFDISTLKPFDKVLVRCSTLEKWHIQLFEKYNKICIHPFICIGYNKYKQCIPYKCNEHLLDTANDCKDFYKTWES